MPILIGKNIFNINIFLFIYICLFVSVWRIFFLYNLALFAYISLYIEIIFVYLSIEKTFNKTEKKIMLEI